MREVNRNSLVKRKEGAEHSNRNCFVVDYHSALRALLGRGPLGQKVAKNAFLWHPSGEHLVCGLFERHIGALPPKKFPKRKTCQILGKRVICDYLLLSCVTAKNVEILNSAITKTTCIMRKSTQNYI